jgi:hypothetical protein
VGLRKTVAINVETNDPVAGFNLLISYDAGALSFINATKEDTYIDEYEYFTYSLNNGACGSACPSGIARLVGIADINNGVPHPPDSVYMPQGPLAYVEFQVANDQNLGDQFVPISFVWYACGDNTFSDVSGSILYMDLRIYGPELNLLWDEEDDVGFPEGSRPFGMGAPDECLVGTEKGEPLRCIEFVNGGICIISPDSIDIRGDINLDGLAYTIADVVLFTNYFIYGFKAFTINIAGQTAATDVNADGITLSVADLAYLIRVIVGDANPIPKLSPYNEELIVTTEVEENLISVETEAVANIGAAYLVYDVGPNVDIGDVHLTAAADGMDLMYSVSDGQLRLLVYNIGTSKIAAGSHEIIEIPFSGDATVRLSHAEIVDYDGRPYKILNSGVSVPTGYSLSQNYPNPFNPSTNIGFTLPQSTPWVLCIYNINGKLVRQYNGTDAAGPVEVIWDGMTTSGELAASGVYFYRLEANEFRETRKMILLK